VKSKLPKTRPPALANRRFPEHAAALQGLSRADIFTYIHRTNLCGSDSSLSGVGSEHDATRILRDEIPALFRRVGARVLLDLPCGDFGWLSQVALDVDEYIGADIVAEIVVHNAALFAGPGSRRRFLQCDVTADPLPQADVVLCRDCLVHLTFADIFRAFANLKRSGSRYLLTTTFLELDANADIVTGDWRPLNLERPPFSLPPPETCIIEGCTEADGAYADKALALWEIASLPDAPLADA